MVCNKQERPEKGILQALKQVSHRFNIRVWVSWALKLKNIIISRGMILIRIPWPDLSIIIKPSSAPPRLYVGTILTVYNPPKHHATG